MSSRPLKVSSGQQSLNIHSFFKSARDQSGRNASSSSFVDTPLVNEGDSPASEIPRIEIIQESPSNLRRVINESDSPASKIPRIEIIQESPSNLRGARTSSKSRREVLNEENAVSVFQRDPGLRRKISEYPINERNDIRRAYLKLGPYQPDLGDEYPLSNSGIQNRAFQFEWFSSFSWLEYSPKNDRAYCFHCFLFPKKKTFNTNGFSSWKRVNCGKKCAFLQHVGGPSSTHQSSVSSCAQLMDPSKHINHLLIAQSKGEVSNNRLRLTTTIKNTLFLALQGFSFRGHDESERSKNPGNFLALIKFQGELNDDVAAVILNNAPKNAKYVSPRIQKEVLHILAERVRVMIRDEVGNAKFSILVDEAQDAADKEQMTIILRFVDGGGFIREQFFKIMSVKNTSALTLKEGICSVLSCYNLHICNIRGQGYDGASNMRGAWNGLQALFCNENPYAYYVHCFAHRLQLALVAASKDEPKVFWFFSKLGLIVNLIDGSSKRRNELQSFYASEIEKLVDEGQLQTGKGANQMRNIQRAAATRWSSHIVSIKSVLDMFGAVRMVLKSIKVNGSSNTMRGEADGCYDAMETFEFVFFLHLLHKIMGITEVLCQALQQKSQDILNAICLVSSTRMLLQELRDNGWADFMENVSSFCEKHAIVVPDMTACHKMGSGRTCQQTDFLTNEHHYRIDMFIVVIEHQILELNNRFTEEAMEILTLSSALSPRDSFKSLKIDDICMLAEKYYPRDFTKHELSILRSQLQHYKLDVPSKEPFKSMTKVSQLCRGLVETRKSEVYTLVYRLICLVLTLPVSTATTERAFSAMKIIKTQLRNKMEDDFLGDSMVIYIEREFADNIDINSVIDEFALKSRRGQFH